MSKTRHFLILVLAQVIILGLGLWIHQTLVVSSLRHSLRSEELAAAPNLLPTLTRTLWNSGAITFVWCSAILGVIGYLLMTRVNERADNANELAAVEELKRTSALIRTQEAVIFGLAKLADSRDSETGDHLERIALYSSSLSLALRRQDEFAEQITPALVQWIGVSSALHDIGKVGIQDAILLKPDKLTPAERSRMQEHTRIGEECLLEIERQLGQSNFLRMAREIAAAHHERWDGRGYPRQLGGEQIPLAARIVAIADVYDALSSERIYKPAIPHEQCVELIRSEAGGQFDPRLVAVFLEIEPTMKNIRQRFQSARAQTIRPDRQGPRTYETCAFTSAVPGATVAS